MKTQVVVFDAYGTLFDVASAARLAAEDPAFAAITKIWPQIAEDWRQKQLQYSWLRAITGDYCDFWEVTKDGLDWALERAGLGDDQPLRERLLALYWELSAYPEVPSVLTTLNNGGLQTAILSNGSPDMLNAAVNSAGLDGTLDAVLSVESAGIFKPASAVYDLVVNRFNCAADEVLFISSNGWDAAAAKGYGFRSAWVNRAKDPIDRLPSKPDHILRDLHDVPALVKG